MRALMSGRPQLDPRGDAAQNNRVQDYVTRNCSPCIWKVGIQDEGDIAAHERNAINRKSTRRERLLSRSRRCAERKCDADKCDSKFLKGHLNPLVETVIADYSTIILCLYTRALPSGNFPEIGENV